MKDQREHWNHAHAEQWLHKHSTKQTAFAEEVNKLVPANSTILELGCGEGNDSIYFAENGHLVTATDFSDVVIRQNEERGISYNLNYEVLDIRNRFNFEDASFDVVYARLSLHYFPDHTTRTIFKEIARVLKPGGSLHFMCKGTKDPIYGKGDKIEDDMYELNGRVRHFFSEEYAKGLLDQAGLRMESAESGKEMIYDRESAFVKVVAKK
jgi:ubiquinone/menaquinone biosynthesis C-methylase UbiE